VLFPILGLFRFLISLYIERILFFQELRSSSPTMTHKQSTTVSTARAVDDTDANMEGEEEELSPLEAQMKQAEVIR
jgi:hypothetical protein